MSELLLAMLAADGPARTDALDHRPVHRALHWLARNRPADSQLPNLELASDPEVGTRAQGVTQALWALAGDEVLLVEEARGQATFRVDANRLHHARRGLMRLSSEDRDAISHAAGIWAAADSTSRKKVRSAASSAAGARRVNDASPRQSSAPARLQAAESLT